MILAAHQPNFLPWIGFFDKMAKADYFVILEGVDVPTGASWAKRTRIKTPHGPRYLTLPVHARRGTTYKEAKVAATQDYAWGLWKQVRHNYARSAHFGCYAGRLEMWFSRLPDRELWLANSEFIAVTKMDLGITTHLIHQGQLQTEGHKSDLMIELCKKTKCDTYLRGQGAKAYNDPEKFEEAGIELRYQEFECPEYDQPWGDFEPNLSIIDLLFNCGGTEARKLLGIS